MWVVLLVSSCVLVASSGWLMGVSSGETSATSPCAPLYWCRPCTQGSSGVHLLSPAEEYFDQLTTWGHGLAPVLPWMVFLCGFGSPLLSLESWGYSYVSLCGWKWNVHILLVAFIWFLGRDVLECSLNDFIFKQKVINSTKYFPVY